MIKSPPDWAKSAPRPSLASNMPLTYTTSRARTVTVRVQSSSPTRGSTATKRGIALLTARCDEIAAKCGLTDGTGPSHPVGGSVKCHLWSVPLANRKRSRCQSSLLLTTTTTTTATSKAPGTTLPRNWTSFLPLEGDESEEWGADELDVGIDLSQLDGDSQAEATTELVLDIGQLLTDTEDADPSDDSVGLPDFDESEGVLEPDLDPLGTEAGGGARGASGRPGGRGTPGTGCRFGG